MSQRIRPLHLLMAAFLGALLQQSTDSAYAAAKAPGWGIGESAYRMANALERIADVMEKKK